MRESSGNIVGYQAIGNLDKYDYAALTKEVQALIDEYDSASLLLDLQDYLFEDMSAWGTDLNFSYKFHGKIEKLAVIGDEARHKHFAKHAELYFTKNTRFFGVSDSSAAWNWLKED
jgi:hypothetical protein